MTTVVCPSWKGGIYQSDVSHRLRTRRLPGCKQSKSHPVSAAGSEIQPLHHFHCLIVAPNLTSTATPVEAFLFVFHSRPSRVRFESLDLICTVPCSLKLTGHTIVFLHGLTAMTLDCICSTIRQRILSDRCLSVFCENFQISIAKDSKQLVPTTSHYTLVFASIESSERLPL